jgi:5'-nucleotidase
MNNAVTDINPPAAPAVAPTPIQVEPSPAPAASETITPAPAVAGGSSYTVKRGDTLYSIARAHYGNGKQYTRILSANPGLSPANMKVGMVITLP